MPKLAFNTPFFSNKTPRFLVFKLPPMRRKTFYMTANFFHIWASIKERGHFGRILLHIITLQTKILTRWDKNMCLELSIKQHHNILYTKLRPNIELDNSRFKIIFLRVRYRFLAKCEVSFKELMNLFNVQKIVLF